MAQTLHLTGSLSQANAEYRKLLEQWRSADKNRGYQLRVATEAPIDLHGDLGSLPANKRVSPR